MTIGLDVGYDPGWTAGLLYVRNLVYALATLDRADTPSVRLLPVTPETVERVHDLERFGFVQVADPGAPLDLRLGIRRVKRKWIQPLFRRSLDGAFSGLDVTYPGFGRPIPGVAQVQWIPDLQHVALPHLFDARELRTRDERIKRFMEGSGIVVVSSEATRADLERFVPDCRATIRVWRFCSAVTEAELGGRDPRVVFGLPDFYLYVANQFWAHKEHLTLFKALVILREAGLTPHVVCTGDLRDDRDPSYPDRVVAFLDEHGMRGQVTLLGLIDRKDQIQVLRRAAAVVQPSRFEGWSTVVEDVKSLGRPLVLSDIAVHLEQVPDARFFRVGDEKSLADTLEEALPALSGGPDADAESAAAARTLARQREAARNFVKIMIEAVGDHASS